MGKKVAYWLSVGILFFTGIIGVYNGITERGDAQNALQKSVTIGVLLYGILGLITGYAVLRGREWGFLTAMMWAAAITYVPGAAVMAYAEEPGMLGAALAASVAGGLIALGVIWATRTSRTKAPFRAGKIPDLP